MRHDGSHRVTEAQEKQSFEARWMTLRDRNTGKAVGWGTMDDTA
ncbi:hypothetical protein ACLIBG_00130 [Virgibacillus sp. W0181]